MLGLARRWTWRAAAPWAQRRQAVMKGRRMSRRPVQSPRDTGFAAQAAVAGGAGQSCGWASRWSCCQELHILTREGAAEPGLAAQARAGLPPVPVHRRAAAGRAVGRWPCAAAGRPWRGQVLPGLHPLRPVLPGLGRGEIYGIEWRAELVERSRALAQRLGFERMQFLLHGRVGRRQRQSGLARALSTSSPRCTACDTATDDAPLPSACKTGPRHGARALLPGRGGGTRAAPNKALSLARNVPLAELWRHPIHTRDSAARSPTCCAACACEACGYQVTVTELVGWEHSLKNESYRHATGHNGLPGPALEPRAAGGHPGVWLLRPGPTFQRG